MQINECHCFTVRKAARQISRLYDDHLEPTGLRITQFLILAALRELGSAAINEISERLDIERTAMGKMATVLERDGLLKIAPAPGDARIRLIQLTKKGLQVLEQAVPLWRNAQSEFEDLNGASKVAVVRRELGALKMPPHRESAPIRSI